MYAPSHRLKPASHRVLAGTTDRQMPIERVVHNSALFLFCPLHRTFNRAKRNPLWKADTGSITLTREKSRKVHLLLLYSAPSSASSCEDEQGPRMIPTAHAAPLSNGDQEPSKPRDRHFQLFIYRVKHTLNVMHALMCSGGFARPRNPPTRC